MVFFPGFLFMPVWLKELSYEDTRILYKEYYRQIAGQILEPLNIRLFFPFFRYGKTEYNDFGIGALFVDHIANGLFRVFQKDLRFGLDANFGNKFLQVVLRCIFCHLAGGNA